MSRTLYDGLLQSQRTPLAPWDSYFPRMAAADFRLRRAELPAVKTYFARTIPFGGGYFLTGGVAETLRLIDTLKFDSDAFQSAMTRKQYPESFIQYLADGKQLRTKIYAPEEGSITLPLEPMMVASAPLAHIRLLEGIMTVGLSFPSLSLTAWHRLVEAASPEPLIDFSRRRAQNPFWSSLSAMLAGCSGTSNEELEEFFDITLSGTWGHEWTQSFGDLCSAFDYSLFASPALPIQLVDNIHAMGLDFPTWLQRVYGQRREILAADPPYWGWRNDSGDLAVLAMKQLQHFYRHPLSNETWFRENARIVLTNGLDEYQITTIKETIRREAWQYGVEAADVLKRIIWAAGERPGSAVNQPILGAVAKLSEVDGLETLKLAFDQNGHPGVKTSLPGFNRSCSILNQHGELQNVLIYPARRYEVRPDGQLFDKVLNKVLAEIVSCDPNTPSEFLTTRNYHAVDRQRLIYDSLEGDGFTEQWSNPSIKDVRATTEASMKMLPATALSLTNPSTIPVHVTPDLAMLRGDMISAKVMRRDKLSSLTHR